jgi:hypothetical protein
VTASHVTHPKATYTWQDSLKFKVNDGTVDSNIATVLINVIGINHAPILKDQNLVTRVNKLLDTILKGSDLDPSDTLPS